MNLGNPIVILALVGLMQTYDCARICFSCTNIAENEQCQHAIVCDANEVCFVQKYRTLRNETRYDVGCTNLELCGKDMTGSILGKRNDHTHVLCQQCCNEKDVCNINLTCIEKLSVPRQRCLACTAIQSPTMCISTTTCEKDEVCFLHKYHTEDKQEHFDMGCKHSTLCLHGTNTNIFGRRLSNGRHFMCETCCSGNETCNSNLHCSDENHKIFNSSCTTTSECAKSLICTAGRCDCVNTSYYWDNYVCFKKRTVNETCTSSQQCVPPLQCGGNICKCEIGTFWNGATCLTKTSECMGIASNQDGIYTIFPNGKDPVKVYCIMNGDKKWTVVQRRMDGSVTFDRTWSEYKIGFGSTTGEYWLGNDNIHLISSNGHHEISFYLEVSAGYFGYANYSTFSVGDEQSKYLLTISGYSGNTSDDMIFQHNLNGHPFTTKDRDNDSSGANCASNGLGGWWYNDCAYSYINRQYGPMSWHPFSEKITKSIMMVRKTQ